MILFSDIFYFSFLVNWCHNAITSFECTIIFGTEYSTSCLILMWVSAILWPHFWPHQSASRLMISHCFRSDAFRNISGFLFPCILYWKTQISGVFSAIGTLNITENQSGQTEWSQLSYLSVVQWYNVCNYQIITRIFNKSM